MGDEAGEGAEAEADEEHRGLQILEASAALIKDDAHPCPS